MVGNFMKIGAGIRCFFIIFLVGQFIYNIIDGIEFDLSHSNLAPKTFVQQSVNILTGYKLSEKKNYAKKMRKNERFKN